MALTNNDIFKKLRVAHHLTNADIVKICALKDFKVTESELGAIFRKEGHPKYVACGDQFLRNFLDGLIIHLRGPLPDQKKNTSARPAGKTVPKSQSPANREKSKKPRISRPKNK